MTSGSSPNNDELVALRERIKQKLLSPGYDGKFWDLLSRELVLYFQNFENGDGEDLVKYKITGEDENPKVVELKTRKPPTISINLTNESKNKNSQKLEIEFEIFNSKRFENLRENTEALKALKGICQLGTIQGGIDKIKRWDKSKEVPSDHFLITALDLNENALFDIIFSQELLRTELKKASNLDKIEGGFMFLVREDKDNVKAKLTPKMKELIDKSKETCKNCGKKSPNLNKFCYTKKRAEGCPFKLKKQVFIDGKDWIKEIEEANFGSGGFIRAPIAKRLWWEYLKEQQKLDSYYGDNMLNEDVWPIEKAIFGKFGSMVLFPLSLHSGNRFGLAITYFNLTNPLLELNGRNEKNQADQLKDLFVSFRNNIASIFYHYTPLIYDAMLTDLEYKLRKEIEKIKNENGSKYCILFELGKVVGDLIIKENNGEDPCHLLWLKEDKIHEVIKQKNIMEYAIVLLDGCSKQKVKKRKFTICSPKDELFNVEGNHNIDQLQLLVYRGLVLSPVIIEKEGERKRVGIIIACFPWYPLHELLIRWINTLCEIVAEGFKGLEKVEEEELGAIEEFCRKIDVGNFKKLSTVYGKLYQSIKALEEGATSRNMPLEQADIDKLIAVIPNNGTDIFKRCQFFLKKLEEKKLGRIYKKLCYLDAEEYFKKILGWEGEEFDEEKANKGLCGVFKEKRREILSKINTNNISQLLEDIQHFISKKDNGYQNKIHEILKISYKLTGEKDGDVIEVDFRMLFPIESKKFEFESNNTKEINMAIERVKKTLYRINLPWFLGQFFNYPQMKNITHGNYSNYNNDAMNAKEYYEKEVKCAFPQEAQKKFDDFFEKAIDKAIDNNNDKKLKLQERIASMFRLDLSTILKRGNGNEKGCLQKYVEGLGCGYELEVQDGLIHEIYADVKAIEDALKGICQEIQVHSHSADNSKKNKTPYTGTIKVILKKDENTNQIIVSISDNNQGVGFPEGMDIGHIFQKEEAEAGKGHKYIKEKLKGYCQLFLETKTQGGNLRIFDVYLGGIVTDLPISLNPIEKGTRYTLIFPLIP